MAYTCKRYDDGSGLSYGCGTAHRTYKAANKHLSILRKQNDRWTNSDRTAVDTLEGGENPMDLVHPDERSSILEEKAAFKARVQRSRDKAAGRKPQPEPQPEAKPEAAKPQTVGSLGALDDILRSVAASEAQRVSSEVVKEALDTYEGGVQALTVKVNDLPKVEMDGSLHSSFEECAGLVKLGLNVMLVGPAGTGKTTLARQIAKSLGLAFTAYSCSEGMSEATLLGKQTIDGGYLRSAFVKAYEEGGLVLLDEIDAGDPNVMCVTHTAIDNGHLSVPSRTDNPVAERHPDFRLIVSANTFGKGADRQYVGRNAMDAATLDRFAVGLVEVDYDSNLERKLVLGFAPNRREGERFLVAIRALRAAVRSKELRRVVSMRFAVDSAKAMQGLNWTPERAIEQLFKGWSSQEREGVKGKLKNPGKELLAEALTSTEECHAVAEMIPAA